jgi:siroheme synthase
MNESSARNNGLRVCWVTTGHPSTNPRLVKEADALIDAGYAVHVVACKFAGWANCADRRFEARPWTVD